MVELVKAQNSASMRPSFLMAQMGDSRLAMGGAASGGNILRYMHAVGSWVPFLTKGKVKSPITYNKAVSSSTSISYVGDGGVNVKGLIPADGSPGQLADVLALDPIPTHCLLLSGTNDIGNGVPFDTMTSTMLTAWASLLSRGIVPVVLLDLPRGWTTASSRQKHFAWNTWLMVNGPRYGAVIIDATPDLMDIANANGDPIASYYYDSPAIHPGNNGCYFAAGPVADYFNALPMGGWFRGFSAGDAFNAANNPYGNKAPNGGIGFGSAGAKTGANITGNVVSGMQVYLISGSVTSCACSIEARNDGGAGNWQKLDITTSGAAQIWFYPTSDIAAAEGEIYEYGVDLEASGMSSNITINARMSHFNGGTTLGSAHAFNVDTTKGPLPPSFAGRAEIDPYTMAAGTTKVTPIVAAVITGAVTNAVVKIGSMSVRPPVAA